MPHRRICLGAFAVLLVLGCKSREADGPGRVDAGTAVSAEHPLDARQFLASPPFARDTESKPALDSTRNGRGVERRFVEEVGTLNRPSASSEVLDEKGVAPAAPTDLPERRSPSSDTRSALEGRERESPPVPASETDRRPAGPHVEQTRPGREDSALPATDTPDDPDAAMADEDLPDPSSETQVDGDAPDANEPRTVDGNLTARGRDSLVLRGLDGNRYTLVLSSGTVFLLPKGAVEQGSLVRATFTIGEDGSMNATVVESADDEDEPAAPASSKDR